MPLKQAMRRWIRVHVHKGLTPAEMARQSRIITQKVLHAEEFHYARRVSMYLNTPFEVSTYDIMKECFRQRKHIYVPCYEGRTMEMVYLYSLKDFELLGKTPRNIRQPDPKEDRENALTNGHGIDLFLVPGYAFSLLGGRLGNYTGYYNTYLKRHQATYPNKNSLYYGLAFKEQIVDDRKLPEDILDVRMHKIITA